MDPVVIVAIIGFFGTAMTAILPRLWDHLMPKQKTGTADQDPAPEPPVVTGQTVDLTPPEPYADRLIAHVQALLEAERGEHGACHKLMRTHGLTPPHD